MLDQPCGHVGSLGLSLCPCGSGDSHSEITLPSTLVSHGAHEVKETPLTISLGQEQPDLFTPEELLSKELQSALIMTEPHGLMCLPCALGYQECTFLLAADVPCWVGGWDAFQLSPYHWPYDLFWLTWAYWILTLLVEPCATCSITPGLIRVSTTYGLAYVRFAVIYFFFSYPYESGHHPWMVGSDFTFTCMCLSKQMSLGELQSRGLRAGQIF